MSLICLMHQLLRLKRFHYLFIQTDEFRERGIIWASTPQIMFNVNQKTGRIIPNSVQLQQKDAYNEFIEIFKSILLYSNLFLNGLWLNRTHNIFIMNIPCVSVFLFHFISFLFPFPFIQFWMNTKYDWTSSSFNNNSASQTQDKLCLELFVYFSAAVVAFLFFLIFVCQMFNRLSWIGFWILLFHFHWINYISPTLILRNVFISIAVKFSSSSDSRHAFCLFLSFNRDQLFTFSTKTYGRMFEQRIQLMTYVVTYQ